MIYHGVLFCLLLQGPAGSDGPPGKDGVLGQRVRAQRQIFSWDFHDASVWPRKCFRETEEIMVQRVWLVLKDFLALLVLLVHQVTQEREASRWVFHVLVQTFDDENKNLNVYGHLQGSRGPQGPPGAAGKRGLVVSLCFRSFHVFRVKLLTVYKTKKRIFSRFKSLFLLRFVWNCSKNLLLNFKNDKSTFNLS